MIKEKKEKRYTIGDIIGRTFLTVGTTLECLFVSAIGSCLTPFTLPLMLIVPAEYTMIPFFTFTIIWFIILMVLCAPDEMKIIWK